MSHIICPPCVVHTLTGDRSPSKEATTRMSLLQEVSAMQMEEQSGRRQERIRMGENCGVVRDHQLTFR
jgi:hypothetical protein